mgnify:FL=1
MSALANEKFMFEHMAVRALPRSGPAAALMDMFKISATCIVQTAQSMLAA